MANYTVVDCTTVYCDFGLRSVKIHFSESERNTIFNCGMYKKIPNAGRCWLPLLDFLDKTVSLVKRQKNYYCEDAKCLYVNLAVLVQHYE